MFFKMYSVFKINSAVGFKKFFLNFTLFCFTILYWFCHTSTWIRHGCICVPNPELPSHLPPYAISLGHLSVPAPSILVTGFSSAPQLDGTHFISLYGILSSWLTASVSLLPLPFWISQTPSGKSGFSILLVTQDDGMRVSSAKWPTHLTSSRR